MDDMHDAIMKEPSFSIKLRPWIKTKENFAYPFRQSGACWRGIQFFNIINTFMTTQTHNRALWMSESSIIVQVLMTTPHSCSWIWTATAKFPRMDLPSVHDAQ